MDSLIQNTEDVISLSNCVQMFSSSSTDGSIDGWFTWLGCNKLVQMIVWAASDGVCS